ncbi:MAG: hypothetical protein H7210_08435, partial [Pyrinomonadaceae bacterium]|nr:hypothetical protein [Phycisphaerales bacterium]
MNTTAQPRPRDCFDTSTSSSGRFHRTMLAIGGLAALTLTGCSSYRAPTVTVAEATLADRTDEGTVMRFTVNASHDNEKVLPLREAH